MDAARPPRSAHPHLHAGGRGDGQRAAAVRRAVGAEPQGCNRAGLRAEAAV